MHKQTIMKFILPLTFLIACSVTPAFAQRGGGSHGGEGGGFHGGGGGGFHSGGGGSYSAPRMGGGGYSRPAASAPARSSGSYARPGGNSYRSYSAPAGAASRGANTESTPRSAADGQWHSFGSTAVSPSETRSSNAASNGSQGFAANRAAGAGSVRSFSGQGNQIWENAPITRNVVPSATTLSTLRGSFGNSLAGTAGIHSIGPLSANSRFSTWNTFGNRIGRFNGGFRGGCFFNCGFGLGFGFWPGWGFGWSGLGFWGGCDPFWDSFYWGCPAYGYGLGYYGITPAGYPYSYDPSYGSGSWYSTPPDAGPSYDSGGVDQGSGQDYDNGSVPDAAATDNSSQTRGGIQVTVPIILYLKDGSAYSVRDYWVSGGQLHYVMLNGSESAFDVDRLDLQRTVNENAKSGVQFILKPNPSSFSPGPGQAPGSNSPESGPRMDLTLSTPSRT